MRQCTVVPVASSCALWRVLASQGPSCSGRRCSLLGQGSRQQVQGDEVSSFGKVRERGEERGQVWHGGDQVAGMVMALDLVCIVFGL
jgi:hypothetical protein